MSIKVRPCPFCGSENWSIGTFRNFAPVAGKCFVHCRDCQSSGPLSEKYDADADLEHASLDAVKKWNRRLNL